MLPILYKLVKNITQIFSLKNLRWHLLFIILTYIIVSSGFDQYYLQSTRGATIQALLWPAAIVGFLMPVVLSISMYIYGKVKNNQRLLNATHATIQAGLLGLGISSLYKVFTGRPGPHFRQAIMNSDISHIFRFGILRGGAFQGWPSSHTAVAFAMSFALITLYSENKFIKYIAFIYALYIGIGVSVNIH